MNNRPIEQTDGLIKTVIDERALKVLRNTYMLLALSMVPTIIGAFIGIQLDFTFVAARPLLTILVYFGLVWGLIFAIQKMADSAIAVPLLLGLTFILGVALGPILQMTLLMSNGAEVIAYAAGTTGAIFFGLAFYVTTTGKDFSGLGKFLFIGMIIAIVALIANIFFQIPAFSLAISSGIVLLMSMYILYDVSRVIHGGQTNYILAALSLYLSIYNLFIHLLRIFAFLSGNRN